MSRATDPFTADTLLAALAGFPPANHYIVGFSGGADSTALLLAISQLRERLQGQVTAVHFHHGLQDAADGWAQSCRQFCQRYDIPLEVHHLALQAKAGSSPETLAREARYAVIKKLLGPGDIYLTAHQAEDQAETVLLNLLRGSGVAGLSGIPRLRRFGAGWLARPLLDVQRSALEDWLAAQQVRWIKDPTNLDSSLDRNFLRNQLIPQLDQRWPGVVMRLHQSAEHLQQRTNAFQELLSLWPEHCPAGGYILSLGQFSQTPTNLQAEIIRQWAKERGAPPPPRARLVEFLAQLQQVHSGSHAELSWRDWIIRHHGGNLWMHELPPPGPCPELTWGNKETLDLGAPFGQLHWRGKPEEQAMQLVVSNRSRLSSNQVLSNSGRKLVKEIMRISGIPDWLRDSIPILLADGELSAIGDWWFSPHFRKQHTRHAWKYTWQVEDPLLKQVQSVCHQWAVDRDHTLG